jgi:hypothetical protein
VTPRACGMLYDFAYWRFTRVRELLGNLFFFLKGTSSSIFVQERRDDRGTAKHKYVNGASGLIHRRLIIAFPSEPPNIFRTQVGWALLAYSIWEHWEHCKCHTSRPARPRSHKAIPLSYYLEKREKKKKGECLGRNDRGLRSTRFLSDTTLYLVYCLGLMARDVTLAYCSTP